MSVPKKKIALPLDPVSVVYTIKTVEGHNAPTEDETMMNLLEGTPLFAETAKYDEAMKVAREAWHDKLSALENVRKFPQHYTQEEAEAVRADERQAYRVYESAEEARQNALTQCLGDFAAAFK